MTYGQFHEALLPPDMSSGFRRRQADGVEIVRLESGAEDRNRRWSRVRRSWTASYGLAGIRKLQRLAAFHEAREGRAFGFRMRDWLDWTTNFDGCNPCAAPTPCDDLLVKLADHDGALSVPLYRHYHSIGRMKRRRIYKPRCAHFRIAVDGVELQAGWKVDPARGLVIFDTLPEGKCVTWGGVYDMPVRFDMDALEIDLELLHYGGVQSIALSELVHQKDVYPETEDDEFAALAAGDEDDLAWALAENIRIFSSALEALPE